jgi:hypothetical protein
MLNTGTTGRGRDFVYCDLVHSHKLWRPMVTEPRRGKLDLGAWLAHRSLIEQVKFDNFNFDGDGRFIDTCASTPRGSPRWPATLMVHN